MGLHFELGSTGYRRKKREFRREKQGLDRKPGKRETPRNRGRRDKENIATKIISAHCYNKLKGITKIRKREYQLKFDSCF